MTTLPSLYQSACVPGVLSLLLNQCLYVSWSSVMVMLCSPFGMVSCVVSFTSPSPVVMTSILAVSVGSLKKLVVPTRPLLMISSSVLMVNAVPFPLMVRW